MHLCVFRTVFSMIKITSNEIVGNNLPLKARILNIGLELVGNIDPTVRC